jgi:hypothetical protein
MRRPAADPPLVGQPEHFSGGVGRFRIAASVSTRELQAEDALVYSLNVQSVGPWLRAPHRPDLRKLQSFKSRFVIQDLPQQDVSGAMPGGHSWQFHYSLKPRSPEVTDVPPLLFAYYKPGVIPPERGYWTTATSSIPLKVQPRGKAVLVDSEGRPLRAPERFYQIAEGPEVLGHEERLARPHLLTLLLLLLGPPALAVAWYVTWKRVYPDAGRLARIRRSHAAVQARKALHAGTAATGSEDAARNAARAVELYLRDRIGLVLAVATPLEVESYLLRAGVALETARKVGNFFRACDAACFSPIASDENLSDAAERLILALESESCPVLS